MKYKCKLCGEEFTEKFPYCPHCGMEMVYPETNETSVVAVDKPKFHKSAIVGFILGCCAYANVSLISLCKMIDDMFATNITSIGAFIGSQSIILAIIGLIFSIIGIKNSKRKVFGIIGAVINGSILATFLIGFLFAFLFIFVLIGAFVVI